MNSNQVTFLEATTAPRGEWTPRAARHTLRRYQAPSVQCGKCGMCKCRAAATDCDPCGDTARVGSRTVEADGQSRMLDMQDVRDMLLHTCLRLKINVRQPYYTTYISSRQFDELALRPRNPNHRSLCQSRQAAPPLDPTEPCHLPPRPEAAGATDDRAAGATGARAETGRWSFCLRMSARVLTRPVGWAPERPALAVVAPPHHQRPPCSSTATSRPWAARS